MLGFPELGEMNIGLFILKAKSLVGEICMLRSQVSSWEMARPHMSLTYSLLSLPFVGLDFHLKFIHQILQSQHILPVLLTLQVNVGKALKEGQCCTRTPSQSGGMQVQF